MDNILTWLPVCSLTTRTTDTTDIQEIDVKVLDNGLQITCTFAMGSMAQGCHVQLIDTSDPSNPLLEQNINRLESTLVASITIAFATGSLQASKTYEVTAVDIEKGGSQGALALSQSFRGTGLPPSSSGELSSDQINPWNIIDHVNHGNDSDHDE